MVRQNAIVSQQLAGSRVRTSQEQRFEPPVGGWNTRDSVDDIPPEDAIILENYIPDIGTVKVRPGFIQHCDTGEAGQSIKSLFEYHDADDLDRKMFCAVNGKIYDVSSSTPVLMNLPHTINNDLFDVSMIETEDSNVKARMAWVNGTDDPMIYKTELSPQFQTGAYTFIPFWEGGSVIVASSLVGVSTFKNRMYYWADNSQDFWYTELYSAEGKLTQFPLGATGNYGGKLVAIETWTRDGGSGPDDFIVFFMSSGEAIVYQGSSPEDIYNWSIVGRYEIGEPLDKRAIVKHGGDLLIVTQNGYVFFSDLMPGVEADTGRSKIVGAAREAIRYQTGKFGWEITNFPREQLIIFNVPTQNSFEQHVLNQVTSAWCKFTGIKANTFCVYKNNLYFSSDDGVVYKAFEGRNDAGVPIYSDIQTAWLRPGGTTPKTFVAWKEHYRSTRELNITQEFEVDYGIITGLSYPDPIEEELLYWTNEDNVVSPGTPWSPDPAPGGTPVGPPVLGGILIDPVLWWTRENYVGAEPPPIGWELHWSGVDALVFGEWEFIYGHGSVISMRKKMATFQFYEILAYRVLYETSGRL